jgi:hypothetical protein
MEVARAGWCTGWCTHLLCFAISCELLRNQLRVCFCYQELLLQRFNQLVVLHRNNTFLRLGRRAAPQRLVVRFESRSLCLERLHLHQ